MSRWSEPYLGGLSLTYDGSDNEHLDTVMAHLTRFGFRATFFAYPPEFVLRVPEWKAVAAQGHEIGNAFLYGATNADGLIPNWPPETIDVECREAEDLIELVSGTKPTSLAMPALRTQWSPNPNSSELEKLLAGATAKLNAETLSPLSHYRSIRAPNHGLNLPGRTEGLAVRSVLADSLNAESLCMVAELAIQYGAWLVLVFGGLRDTAFKSEDHERFLIWLAQKQRTLKIDTFGENALRATGFESVKI